MLEYVNVSIVFPSGYYELTVLFNGVYHRFISDVRITLPYIVSIVRTL